MNQTKSDNGILLFNPSIRLLVTLLLFLAIPVILFWRPGQYFFMLDDWTAILVMSNSTFWNYLMMSDAEMLTPFSRLIYYLLIQLFGVHYGGLILINCLLTGVNAFLFFVILKNHFDRNLALALAIVYAGAAVQTATAQMAYYINAIICLSFFLLSLWLTQHYVRRPSLPRLLGIGIFAWFSVNSWNFTLLAIWALPVYAGLFGGESATRKFWLVTLVIGSAFLGFAAEYLVFAGFGATKSHNPNIFSQFLSLSFFTHWVVGAFLAPFYFLLLTASDPFGSFRWGLASFVPAVVLVLWAGKPEERKLCYWALLVNALPFLLVSLARHHFHFGQAFGDRYGIFTIIGSLMIVGTIWQIIADKLPAHLNTQVVLPLIIWAAMIWAQVHTLPLPSRVYIGLSQEAKTRYDNLRDAEVRAKLSAPEERNRLFFNQNQPITVHPFLTNENALAVYRYLSELP